MKNYVKIYLNLNKKYYKVNYNIRKNYKNLFKTILSSKQNIDRINHYKIVANHRFVDLLHKLKVLLLFTCKLYNNTKMLYKTKN